MNGPKHDEPIMEQEGLVNAPEDRTSSRDGSGDDGAGTRRAASASDIRMGAAGHESETDEPSAMGSAGIYATTIHPERAEAEEAGQRAAD